MLSRCVIRTVHTAPEDLLKRTEKALQRLVKRTKKHRVDAKTYEPQRIKRAQVKSKRIPVDLVGSEFLKYQFFIPEGHRLMFDDVPKGTTFQLRLNPSDSSYTPIVMPDQDDVPTLKHKLSRILFSPGVHYLQDPRTKVFNFDPYIHKIMPVEEFNFDIITKYVTSSKDKLLLKLSKQHGQKYYSSTSSMTGVLSQMHFLFSNFRPASLMDFTRHHPEPYGRFTKATKMAAAVIVKKQKDGIYSIDSDKSTDKEIVLSLLGHSLERLLTKTPSEFEKYRKPKDSTLSIDKELEGNTYHYAKMDNFLMRSQLDCKDERLPGTGTFDLKTRAVNAVRYDVARVEREPTGYRLVKTFGKFESFEREQLDLARSTLIKYGLQARIGNMDGIFVAYHNIATMFGFEYLPLSRIDEIIHSFGLPDLSEKSPSTQKSLDTDDKTGLSCKLANDEFKLSMRLWNQLLELIIKTEIPNSSFRFIVKAISVSPFETKLRVIAVPISQENIEILQNKGSELQYSLIRGESEHSLDGLEHVESVEKLNESLCVDPVGFDVFIKNYIDGEVSTSRHPIILNSSQNWTADVKVVKLSIKDATDSYGAFLRERTNMLRGNFEGDKEPDHFVRTLREYGRKGERLQELEDIVSKTPIWNDE